MEERAQKNGCLFCIIWCFPSLGCMFVLLPLWKSSSSCMTACLRRRRLQLVELFPCSNESADSCIFVAWAWLGLIFGVWRGDPVICSLLIASKRSGIFDLLHLWSGFSEEPFRRTHIHPILRPWLFCGLVWLFLFCQTGFSTLMLLMMIPVLS